jgi:hypothetical protein
VSALEAKKRKLMKRILEVGFSGLDDLELRRFRKWFNSDEEEAISEQIHKKVAEPIYEQETLF